MLSINNNLYILPLFAFSIFLLSLILTWLLMKYANYFKLIDMPNERSLHSSTIPRGGGIVIYVSFCFSLCILYIYRYIQLDFFLSLMIGGGIVCLVGLLDDLNNLSPLPKLFSHIIAVLVSLFFLKEIPGIASDNSVFYDSPIIVLFFFIYIIWVINLYNFMDGIDGLAPLEAVSILFSLSVIIIYKYLRSLPEIPHTFQDFICFMSGLPEPLNGLLITNFLFIPAVLGFLIWNWPAASIFLGDSGSFLLGYLFGFITFYYFKYNVMNFWPMLIILGVFFVDTTVNLLRRFIKGENLFKAHRGHAYQVIASKIKSHKKVTIGILLVNVFWLLPFAYLAAIHQEYGLFLAILAFFPLIILAFNYGLRKDY